MVRAALTKLESIAAARAARVWVKTSTSASVLLIACWLSSPIKILKFSLTRLMFTIKPERAVSSRFMREGAALITGYFSPTFFCSGGELRLPPFNSIELIPVSP